MRKNLLLFMLVTLAGCQRATTHSLAGEWVMMDGFLQYPLACGSHGPITYRADGTYTLWGEAGTWRLDGDKLTSTMTGYEPLHIDRSPDEVGKSDVSTIRWLDRDRFTKQFADGDVYEFRRCPARG